MEHARQQLELDGRRTLGAAFAATAASADHEDFHCSDRALGLYAVAEGSSGGWIVSRTLIRALRQFIAETGETDHPWPFSWDGNLSHAGNRLRSALHVAAGTVAGARTSALSVAALLWSETSVAVARTGECQVYLARCKRVDRVLPATPCEDPRDTLFERHAFLIGEVAREPDDRWLACSRGIHDVLTDAEIASVLLDDLTPEAVADRLVTLAGAARQSASLLVNASRSSFAEKPAAANERI